MDFIGEFLQAIICKPKLFLKLDIWYKDACTELTAYFNTPLQLNKAMYGLTFVRKLWNDKLFNWLYYVSFVQSREEHVFWVHYDKHSAYVKFLVDTENSLYYTSNKKNIKCLKNKSAENLTSHLVDTHTGFSAHK